MCAWPRVRLFVRCPHTWSQNKRSLGKLKLSDTIFLFPFLLLLLLLAGFDSTVYMARKYSNKALSQLNFEHPAGYDWDAWKKTWPSDTVQQVQDFCAHCLSRSVVVAIVPCRPIDLNRRIHCAFDSTLQSNGFADVLAGVGDNWLKLRSKIQTLKRFQGSVLQRYSRPNPVGIASSVAFVVTQPKAPMWSACVSDTSHNDHRGSNIK